ncbi:MAG: hypothetical protein NTV46_03100 [Verrucomicrobia bacterium]|nr:hypothetical protein [Verrucomicrobiota bacterium]
MSQAITPFDAIRRANPAGNENCLAAGTPDFQAVIKQVGRV